MKDYISYFKPGDKIPVLNADGTEYGSEMLATNLRNMYEYLKLAANKIRRYGELKNKLEEIGPKNTKTTSYSDLWNLFHFLRNSTDPRYLSLFGEFRGIDDSTSSNTI